MEQDSARTPAGATGTGDALISGLTHVPRETRDECRMLARARTLTAREHVPNTQKAYVDTVFCSKGNPLEWNTWCIARPDTEVYGVMTKSSKVVHNHLVTPEKVEQFMMEHLIHRSLLNSKGQVIE